MANTESKKPASYKFEGAEFDLIKARVDAHQAAHEAVERTHQELWETIGELCPAVDPDSPKNHSLNTEFAEHRIYFVEEQPECGCGMDHEAIARAFGAAGPLPMPGGLTAALLRSLRSMATKKDDSN